ncbi:MAG: hypothetical protein J6I85_01360 [Clostridia bacterium]|nr:hypothetical protein [Clostridia bacterium]
MDKIYSRPRLRIPKIIINRKNKNRKSKNKIKIIIILIVAVMTVKLILDSVLPIFDKLCENKAISLATKISNSKATEVMKNYTYDELFSINKDENGNITMMNLNIIPMNELTSKVAVMIQDEIDKQGKEDIEIPLRKFYWV